MRLPHLRFTLRSVMIAVAVAGVVFAGVRLKRQQSEYGQQAASHGAQEVALRARAAWAGRMAAKGYVSRREGSDSRASADHHARLRAIYERAATHRWLSVEPNETGPRRVGSSEGRPRLTHPETRFMRRSSRRFTIRLTVALIAASACVLIDRHLVAEPDRPARNTEAETTIVRPLSRPKADEPLDGEALAPPGRPPTGAEFKTVAEAKAASFANPPVCLRLAGYYTPGDHGGGLYRPAAEPPSHAAKFQSADGRWWELAESLVRPEQLGAKGDGSDDTTAVSNWLGFIASRAIGFLPARRFVVGPIRARGPQ